VTPGGQTQTGPVGAVTPPRPAPPHPSNLPFQDACSVSSSSPGVWLGVADAKGVGDALAVGGGLAVDAVGVDLEQDRDAVPGAAGDLGGGHPGVQPERHRRVPQVVGAAAER